MLMDLGERRPPTPYAPPLVPWEDFHDCWDSERRQEWVDGEIIDVSPENIRHLLLTDFLADLIKTHVRRRKLGLVLFTSFLMRLHTRPSGRLPDVMFVATEHLNRVKATYLDGPADLVVEIVSPQSESRDRHDKLAEYEAAGIPEYWVIDEPRRQAFFYLLDRNGQYQLVPPGEDGIYASTVLPELRLRLGWLWQWPLPALDEALADLPA